MRIVIVADDATQNSRFIGKTGEIVGWRPNPHRTDDGKIPIIRLEDGQVVSKTELWWSEKP